LKVTITSEAAVEEGELELQSLLVGYDTSSVCRGYVRETYGAEAAQNLVLDNNNCYWQQTLQIGNFFEDGMYLGTGFRPYWHSLIFVSRQTKDFSLDKVSF
jgi:hypothetical protein